MTRWLTASFAALAFTVACSDGNTNKSAADVGDVNADTSVPDGEWFGCLDPSTHICVASEYPVTTSESVLERWKRDCMAKDGTIVDACPSADQIGCCEQTQEPYTTRSCDYGELVEGGIVATWDPEYLAVRCAEEGGMFVPGEVAEAVPPDSTFEQCADGIHHSCPAPQRYSCSHQKCGIAGPLLTQIVGPDGADVVVTSDWLDLSIVLGLVVRIPAGTFVENTAVTIRLVTPQGAYVDDFGPLPLGFEEGYVRPLPVEVTAEKPFANNVTILFPHDVGGGETIISSPALIPTAFFKDAQGTWRGIYATSVGLHAFTIDTQRQGVWRFGMTSLRDIADSSNTSLLEGAFGSAAISELVAGVQEFADAKRDGLSSVYDCTGLKAFYDDVVAYHDVAWAAFGSDLNPACGPCDLSVDELHEIIDVMIRFRIFNMLNHYDLGLTEAQESTFGFGGDEIVPDPVGYVTGQVSQSLAASKFGEWLAAHDSQCIVSCAVIDGAVNVSGVSYAARTAAGAVSGTLCETCLEANQVEVCSHSCLAENWTDIDGVRHSGLWLQAGKAYGSFALALITEMFADKIQCSLQ